MPARGRQTGSRSGGRLGRASGSRQQPATVGCLELNDDEWQVDDAEKIPHESTTERRGRLTSTVPGHAAEHDITSQQMNSGYLLYFISCG